MQAVEKPKCETISPWALQGDRKISLGSQPDQRAKYNAKEVGQNIQTTLPLIKTPPVREHDLSASWVRNTRTEDMHQSLFCISSLSTNLGSGQNSDIMKGNFSFQFHLTGKLTDSLQQCLTALSFCQHV